MSEVQLKVAKAYPNDNGRGIARLDPDTLMRLQVSPGDYVEIEGEDSTLAKVWRADSQDWDSGSIRIDGFTRQNAGVSIGDTVTVTKTSPEDADEITLAPPKGKAIQFRRGAEDMVKRQLLKRPVGKRDVVPVMSSMQQPFTGKMQSGQTIPLVAINTSPGDQVVITESTEITLRKKPVKGYEEVKAAGVTYEDIGGLQDEVQRVREMVELPLRHPELFQRLGIDPPKGVLLHGPPGTGKTLIAKAVSNESGANFFSIKGPEIMSKYYGESEEQLREIFQEAKEESPSIIFIDEVDSIAPKREDVMGEVERRVVAQMLSLMDGLEERGEVVVIGATNRIEAVDPALRRPGRFDREISIGVPDKDGRKEIFQIHTRGMPIKADKNPEAIANGIKDEVQNSKDTIQGLNDIGENLEASEEPEDYLVERKRKERQREREEGPVRMLEAQLNTEIEGLVIEEGAEEEEDEAEAPIESEEVTVEPDNLLELIENTVEGLEEEIDHNLELLKDFEKSGTEEEALGVFEGLDEADQNRIEDILLDRLIDHVSESTHGFTGADIEALAKESGMKALSRHLPEIDLEQEEIDQELLESMYIEREDLQSAMKLIEPSALREVILEVPSVTWDQVGGLEGVKRRVKEMVEWPLTQPEKFDRLGIDPPKGVLLYGPPGTGKTLMAKAVSNETESNFIYVKGPELLSKWVGESEEGIREIFKKARQTAPTIIFFDELDAIAPKRGEGGGGSRVTERVVNQILTELDGLEELEDVVVIGATNRPDIIDQALYRPGRFDRRIHVPVPDRAAREKIIEIHTSRMPLAEDFDVSELADELEGYTGSDVEGLAREAAMISLREDPDSEVVKMKHFLEAAKEVQPTVTEDIMQFYEEMEEQFKSGGIEEEEEELVGYR